MKALLIMVLAFAGYLVAYHTYGRFLARKIFKLNPKLHVPSERLCDDKDYVPTRRGILFGHHFTSIAGTGPIVGPAIGVIWGWLPALIWVLVGSVVMGAVHDFGTLVISLRNDGLSVSECSARFLGLRVRYIFFCIIFLELLIVVAIFGLVIAVIFKEFPAAVIPVWSQIPIAVGLGWAVYRKRWNVNLCTAIAVLFMYGTVLLGVNFPLTMPAVLGIPPTGVWTIMLLIYALIASLLPVTVLLQPRDYINAWQLVVAMGLLVLSVIAAACWGGLEMVAPAYNAHPEGAPSIVPFLFITIACGAISGFHSLVSSGTSSKQLANERDAQFVGYGSMLMEGGLAVLVLIAVAAGIGLGTQAADGTAIFGVNAWHEHYASWGGGKGLGDKIGPFVTGSANMMTSLGIPKSVGMALIGVFVASFAGTTLDTATRLQRYTLSELFVSIKNKPFIAKNCPDFFGLLAKPLTATLIAVVTAAWLAFSGGANGAGAMTLWPMFGGVNQLLAALGLLLLTAYLRKQGGRAYLISLFPCLFMLVITLWSVALNEMAFVKAGDQWLLAAINGCTLLLATWMTIEGFVPLFKCNFFK